LSNLHQKRGESIDLEDDGWCADCK